MAAWVRHDVLVLRKMLLVAAVVLVAMPGGLSSEYAAGIGISPGMIRGKQHRCIVNLEVPPALPNLTAYRRWMAEALSDVTRLVRNYLLTKSKTYPAERLASDVEDPRVRWEALNSDR